MSNQILYYPTIQFQEQDYNWLWRASLLWDRIYRIVPENYILKEPSNIQELCSTGEIGIPLSPNRYSKEASAEFMRSIKKRAWHAAALEFNHAEIKEYEIYCRLHRTKVDVALRELMLMSQDAYEENDWLNIPRGIANQYMIFLATEIASRNSLSLYTYNPDVWATSTFFMNPNTIQDNFYPGSDYIEDSRAALVQVFFKDIFPQNILGLPASKILEFRAKRADERAALQTAIDDFCNRLSLASDPKILEQIMNDEKAKVEDALANYRRSMDMMRVVQLGGYIAALTTLGTDVMGYTSLNSHVIQGLTTAGIGIGLLTGVLEKRMRPHQTPYSYLSSIKDLSADCFNECNYLYRKIEEFIND